MDLDVSKDPVLWSKNALRERGYSLLNNGQTLQKTPYSALIKFSTSNGNVFLKITPPSLYIEADIIQILRNKFDAFVPSIIDANPNLSCFLMKDAGFPLHDYLKNKFASDLLIEAIRQYTRLQKAIVNKTDIFINHGVPDWELSKLPALYLNLISNDVYLRKDGLSEIELTSLQSLYPIFVNLCEMLSEFKIPKSLDHCDFHDNNILITLNDLHLTLIDLGEVVITHPFFSLISFVSKTAYRYALNENHPVFLKMLEACFENWLSYNNQENLKKCMLITKKIWPIYSALGYHRLMTSSGMGMDETTQISYFGSGRNKGRYAKYFKDFIFANKGINPNDFSQVKLSDPGSREIK